MARKTTKARSRTVTVVEPPAPIVVSSRAPARRRSSGGVRRRRGGGRRRSRRSGGGGLNLNKMAGHFAGGAAVGWIEKTWGDKLPTLPIVGRKGAIALGAYYLRSSFPFATDIATSAAAIAGYQFGAEGHVTGEDDYDDDGVARQA